jgi:hypothetical protein
VTEVILTHTAVSGNKTIAVRGAAATPFLTAVYEGREIKRNPQT